MTDRQTAVIFTKSVTSTKTFREVCRLFIGTEPDLNRVNIPLHKDMTPFNNPGVDEALVCAEREYDPAEYDDGTVVARIQPDGTTKWPLEADR